MNELDFTIRWYKVEDKLPTDAAPILVYSKKHSYNEVATYNVDHGYFQDVYLEVLNNVSHWSVIKNPI